MVTSPKEPLVWMADMELGHPTIDGQHQSLVELVGRLQATLNEGGVAQVADIVEQLEYYVLIHFSFEEEWMQKEAVMDLAEHLSEHRQFELAVAQFKSRFQAGEQVAEEMAEYLADWLHHHIMMVDRKYAVQLGLLAGL